MRVDKQTLQQRQAMPLEAKVAMSKQRIKEWYDYFNGQVYVSFSGGKDSTVLVDLVKNTPGVHDVPVVFCNTGLEYPEVREFGCANSHVILSPCITFVLLKRLFFHNITAFITDFKWCVKKIHVFVANFKPTITTIYA